MKKGHTIDRRAALAAHTFGSLIRSRRQALAMSHLGRSLVIAQALGLRAAQPTSDEASLPALDLPDIPGDEDG
jgi:hypothetical protein